MGEKCLTQLWSLTTGTPEKPILLGEFDDPTLLPPLFNTPIENLQFITGEYRWQTDGTLLGTKTLSLEPLSSDWKKDRWLNKDIAPILALNSKKGGWIMPYYDAKNSGLELWWASPNTKDSYLLKDINTAPANATKLLALRAVGENWYYGLNKKLWFIKKLANNTFAAPQQVENLPNDEDYNYYGVKQDEKSLYIARNSKQDHWLWQVEQGKAKPIAVPVGSLVGTSQKGFYLQQHNQPKGFPLQHWQNGSLNITSPPKVKGDYSEIAYETLKGLVYEGHSEEKTKSNTYIWWQPTGSQKRQLIYKSSKENFIILDILATENEIYALRMDENSDLYDLVRFDLKNNRFIPIKEFTITINSPNTLYSAHATSTGLFIYSKNKGQTQHSLWFLADNKQKPHLIKQNTANLSMNSGCKIWNNSCYFTLTPTSNNTTGELELWVSQGTTKTTRLIKKGVGIVE